MNIQAKLFELQDEEYGKFQAMLTPGIPLEKVIGVRIPAARKLAKEILSAPETEEFLNTLPHQYYDENILHAILISEIKDYDQCMAYTEAFLPFVDNWAVCDIMSPKVFKKHKPQLMTKIIDWSEAEHIYTCRFGLKMLMTHFLDEHFQPTYLAIPASINTEEYYLRMMIAWFFATALAKQWNASITIIEQNVLDRWTHNKTIQKACESYRITNEQKTYLRTLKRK